MSQAPLATICRCAIASALFLIATAWPPATFAADGCPDSASEISTDRPDVTNSSRVVPYGSLQAENGVDWTVRQRSDVDQRDRDEAASGRRAMHRVVWPTCRRYFYSLNGRASSGFSDFVVSVKRELPVPLGFHLSATGGLGFPDRRQQNFEPWIRSLRSASMVATNQ